MILGNAISPFGLGALGGAANTVRTQAFIDASGLSDESIISALNTFDQALLDNSIVLQYWYPIVGGTAALHSWNFMDTSKYQITWNGGWTHTANGAVQNGTNTWADTNYLFSTQMADVNDSYVSVAYYDNVLEAHIDGVESGSRCWIYPRWTDDRFRTIFISPAINSIDFASTDSRGLKQLNRTASNAYDMVDKGVFSAQTDVSATLPLRTMKYGARDNNGATISNYGNKTWIGGGAGASLTNAQLTALNTAFDNFNNTLGRKTW